MEKRENKRKSKRNLFPIYGKIGESHRRKGKSDLIFLKMSLKLPFFFKLIDNFSKVKNQFLKVLRFSKDINNDDSDSEDPLD